MPAVSESIVREYFELHGFLLRQHRKFVAPGRRAPEQDDIDFFVLNPHPQRHSQPLPFVLEVGDLKFIEKAIVVVKGWHTETFSSARMEHTPRLFGFVQPAAFRQAARAFGEDGQLMKILVVPALPQAAAAREQSIDLLRAKGVDAVIAFRTILFELVKQTEPNRNYQKSDLLQIIRILKNYELFKEPQLELFKTRRRRRVKSSEGKREMSESEPSAS